MAPPRSSGRNHRQPTLSSSPLANFDPVDTLDPALRDVGHQSASPTPNHQNQDVDDSQFSLGSLAAGQNDMEVDQLDSSPIPGDPLTDFARQVIESEHPMDDDDDEDDNDENEEPFLPEVQDQETIDAAVRAAADMENVAHARELLERANSQQVDSGLEGDDGGDDETSGPGPLSNKNNSQTKGGRSAAAVNKRKRGIYGTAGALVQEESRDLARMKKDSHKEVERKRRDNISEGINQIGKLVPGCTEKMGKGQVLKLAAQYLSEVAVKVGDLGGIDKVRPEIEADKLQNELAVLQAQLSEEHIRCANLERSWQEAEERAATSQFDLERIKKELEDARMQLLENRR